MGDSGRADRLDLLEPRRGGAQAVEESRSASEENRHDRDDDLGEQACGEVLLRHGGPTYRLMSRFAAEGEPGTDALAGMPKVVFSTTLSEPLSWANTKLVSADAVEAVREMKANGSESMRAIGSLMLCRSLLTAGLVDRFRVVVFPVITGSSGRGLIYDGYPDVALEMVGSRTFDGRIQLLEYVPTILAVPPGNARATP